MHHSFIVMIFHIISIRLVMKCVFVFVCIDWSPRRTPDVHNIADSPSSERFFVAEKRLKFRTLPSAAKLEKAKKIKESKVSVKKPRKGNRQGIDRESKIFQCHYQISLLQKKQL